MNEPIFVAVVSGAQRGFIKGRTMLNNVIEIDKEAMIVSLKLPQGALVFRLCRRFPSVDQFFSLMHALQHYEIPDHSLNLMSSLP